MFEMSGFFMWKLIIYNYCSYILSAIFFFIFIFGSELAKKRAFTEPVVYNVLDAGVAGPKTLSEFRFKELEKYREDELRQFGLTQDEIEFKLKTGNIETVSRNETIIIPIIIVVGIV